MNNTLILRGGESLARDTRTVFELLEKQGGLLEVRLPGRLQRPVRRRRGRRHAAGARRGDVRPVLARGDIGLAEAYLDGLWDSPDITGLLTLLASNRDVLQKASTAPGANCWPPASATG
jgi:cyclopropane-fatty-acyl-phospholipid synthase